MHEGIAVNEVCIAPRGIVRALLSILIALVLSFGLAPVSAFGPTSAFGEEAQPDKVAGYPMTERGITASNAPSITAKHAYVVDSDGKVYFERDADAESNIASVTKIMTAVLALESGELDRQLTVSENAASIGESSAYLVKGDIITLENALIGLMVPSGNDAATTIAENLGADMVSAAKEQGTEILDAGGNPVDLDGKDAGYNAFVAKMNEKAKEIGMENSLFTNPHGLDVKQFKGEKLHSTARDVSTMSVYAMQNPDFRRIVAMGDTKIEVNRDGKKHKIALAGTDTLIGSYDGACGIKTGFTDTAGGCFSGACVRDGKYLYAVVLGSSSNDQKFDDAKAVYEWVYGSECDVPLAKSDEKASLGGEVLGSEVPVVARVPHSEWTDKTVAATIPDPEQTVHVSSIFGNVSQSVQYDEVKGHIAIGDTVGSVNYYQGNELVESVPLIACEEVDSPGPLDSIAVAWSRFVGQFTGQPETADMVVYNKIDPILQKS